MKSLVVAGAIFLAASCAVINQRPQAPVVGTLSDQERFAGVWRSRGTDVEIELRIPPQGGSAEVRLGAEEEHVPLLWVRVSGSTLAGAFEPRFDPGCGCNVYATFEAVLDGSQLHGTLQRRVNMVWQAPQAWNAERVVE